MSFLTRDNMDSATPPARALEEAVELMDNPEPRCCCVLLTDVSSSMAGASITALNHGLETFREALNQDPLTKKRVEVAVVTFASDVQVVQDFITVDQFRPPQLEARGLTVMGSAILKGLDLIANRKATFKATGIDYYRPWMFLITDGVPEGEPVSIVEQAAQRVQAAEAAKQVVFFAVAVEGANMHCLQRLSVRTPIKLRGVEFDKMFLWLSCSIRTVTQSQLGQQVALAPPDSDFTV
jgi:uncharacterized protein YegL